MQVLVVEDNPVAQQATSSLLETLDCKVDTATTGMDAMSMFERKKYDIIFMDIGLPDIDGYCMTKIFQQSEKESEKTVIIALTASYDGYYKDYAERVGMSEFMEKPLSMAAAKRVINKYAH